METATGEETFFEFLQRLYAQKHCGPVVIQFLNGQPEAVEIPAEPARIRLDKTARNR
jgi:hypothetical protein